MLGRPWVNADVFNEVFETPTPALLYFDGRRQKNPLDLPRVPSGAKLMKRLLVDVEGGLGQFFLSAIEQVSHNVCALNFAELSIGSIFGVVEINMQSFTSILHAQAQTNRGDRCG